MIATATVALAVLTACTSAGGSDAPDAEQAPGTAGAAPPALEHDPDPDATEEPTSGTGDTPTARDPSCLDAAPVARLRGDDPATIATAAAARTDPCPALLVVADARDPWAPALAAAVASAHGVPLLLDPAAVAGAFDAPPTQPVVLVGSRATGGLPEDAEVVIVAPLPTSRAGAPPPATQLGLAVARHLDATRLVAVPEHDVRARAAAIAHLRPGDAIVPLPDDPDVLASVATELVSLRPPGGPPAAGTTAPAAPRPRVEVLAEHRPTLEALVATLVAAGADAHPATAPVWPEGGGSVEVVWLADPSQPWAAAVAARAAAAEGAAFLPVDATDLRRGREDTDRIGSLDATAAVLVGDVAPDADRHLPMLLGGPRLPGGGLLLFEDQRIVALYGHPTTPVLGALGEQDLDATVERARQVAEPYGQDGRRVLPAFELIATIASARPEPTGDYSRRTPIADLRPWVDRAADEGFYVVLDLQPGRTDLLDQAREYEELLREPHVGLALDPEWRLLPHQVHLTQIGAVEAEEVQRVADWLAGLTRDAGLPQKLLVLHQFRLSMLPDRDTIEVPPELAVVVHMDGQGSQPAKDATYRAITAGAEERWWWGWKNFYDEDVPTATPERVLALDPVPVFVSYQ